MNTGEPTSVEVAEALNALSRRWDNDRRREVVKKHLVGFASMALIALGLCGAVEAVMWFAAALDSLWRK
jgi:hypothetical protein